MFKNICVLIYIFLVLFINGLHSYSQNMKENMKATSMDSVIGNTAFSQKSDKEHNFYLIAVFVENCY